MVSNLAESNMDILMTKKDMDEIQKDVCTDQSQIRYAKKVQTLIVGLSGEISPPGSLAGALHQIGECMICQK